MSDILEFTVPLTPPSVNHYVKHTRTGRHYVTSEALAFKQAVGVFVRGRVVIGGEFRVDITVYLAKSQKLDVDSAPKCCLDAMQECGVFNGLTDAAVKVLKVTIGRDASNPRTEIKVRAI